MISNQVFVAIVVGLVVGVSVSIVMFGQGRRGSVVTAIIAAVVAFGLYWLLFIR